MCFSNCRNSFYHLYSSFVCTCLPQTSDWLNSPENIFSGKWSVWCMVPMLIWSCKGGILVMSAEISVCCWTVKQKPNCLILAPRGLQKPVFQTFFFPYMLNTLPSSLMFVFWCHAGSRWELLLVGWPVYAVQGTQFFPWEVFQWCDKEDCQGRKGQSEVKYYINSLKKWEKNEDCVSL